MLLFERYFQDKEFIWKPGLERIKRAVREIGGKSYPSIIVAGTNGKGSTCHFIAEILKKHGLRVGLFTSPHLFRFSERIKVDLREVNDEALDKAFYEVKGVVEKHELTYFEASLVLALKVFEEFKVDCAVFEVGLGGRLDATNVLDHEVGVITTVGLDHQNYLGDTLEEIFAEKLAVLKPGMVGVVSKNDLGVLEKFSDRFPEETYFYGADFWEDEVSVSLSGTSFYYMSQVPVSLKVVGKHQAVNAACALKVSHVFVERFLERKFFIPQSIDVTLKGRFEVLRQNPPLLFDVAHNEDALKSLFSTLKELNVRASVFYGGLKDKNQLVNLRVVKEYLDWSGGEFYAVSIDNERGLKAEEILEIAKSLGIKGEKAERIEVGKVDFPAVVTGSFYLIDKIKSERELQE